MKTISKKTLTGLAVVGFASLACVSSLYLTAPAQQPTANCENEDVVAEVTNRLACAGDFWMKCEPLGYKWIANIEGQTKQQIRERVGKTLEGADNRIVEASIEAVQSLPGLFDIVQPFTDDYNPRISKYACHLTIRLNRKSLEAGLRMSTLFQLLKDPITSYVDQAQMKGATFNIVDLAMKAAETEIQPAIMRNLSSKRIDFTVQLSSDGGHVVDIVDFDKIE